jgi:hypothetical protein
MPPRGPDPPRREPPEVRRVSYAEHAREAARREHPHDPDTAGAVAAEATRMAPLQDIQVAFDQLYARAQERRRGAPWEHSGPGYPQYAKDVIAHARRRASVLVVAADAAMSMVGRMTDQVRTQEDAMTDEANDEPKPNVLTPSGAPHPLQAGGYDADADLQLPSNESDIAAGKAGHTTRAQAEAIGRGDAAAAEDARRAQEEAAERSRVRSHTIPPRKEVPPSPQQPRPNPPPQQPRPDPPPPRQPAPGPPKK